MSRRPRDARTTSSSITRLHIGSGARYANIYPLWHTEGVSEGQQQASDKKRVFILSRSAYAGSQRLGVTAWSGDVLSDWETFARQIPAGLNYSISGMPYWTTDIGGFISGGNLNDPKFRELFVRWFQFGAFSPIFRVHGTRNPDENELWSYGPEAQKILVDYDNLRYRLLPYIYSEAWQVTSNHGTLMRPLVMDWREDVEAQNTGDEYLFGPAILVSPVTTQGATSRKVYLPKATWYDFWTGAKVGGRKVHRSGCAAGEAAAVCARGFDYSDGADDGVVNGEACRSDRDSRLSRSRWRLHALRRRERQLRLRQGTTCNHSVALG